MEDAGSVKVDSDGFLFQGGSGTLWQIQWEWNFVADSVEGGSAPSPRQAGSCSLSRARNMR